MCLSIDGGAFEDVLDGVGLQNIPNKLYIGVRLMVQVQFNNNNEAALQRQDSRDNLQWDSLWKAHSLNPEWKGNGTKDFQSFRARRNIRKFP